MLVNKIIRTDVGHIDRVAWIIGQHLLRQFLEGLEAMRGAYLEEGIAIFLHNGREKVVAGFDSRIFPCRVTVAVVVNQTFKPRQCHVWAVLLVADKG